MDFYDMFIIQGEQMDRIIICKELLFKEDTNNKMHYYKLPVELEKEVKPKKIIYIVKEEEETNYVSMFQIVKIDDLDSINRENNITTLPENEKIYLVSEDYFFDFSEQITDEDYNYSIRELRKFLNKLISNLNKNITDIRKNPINNKRKKYLLKTFYKKNLDEYYKKTEDEKSRLLMMYNNYELGFIHMINLFYLNQNINQLIEMNKTLCNIDKTTLKDEYSNKLEMTINSISLKGHAKYQINGYIGIDTSSDGKYLILGRMSPLEIYISFASIWNNIKNLLTVAFVPIIIALLNTDKKIMIYFLLGIVYLLILILSDEKQTEKMLVFVNKFGWNKKRKTNASLFYFGSTVLITFMIFSFQVVYLSNIFDNIRNYVMYLTGDILLAFTALFALVVAISFFFYLITVISSTLFYIKRAKKFSIIFSVCFKIIFLMFCDYCLFYILSINESIYNMKQLEWNFIVFGVALMVSLFKIIENLFKFKESIKD